MEALTNPVITGTLYCIGVLILTVLAVVLHSTQKELEEVSYWKQHYKDDRDILGKNSENTIADYRKELAEKTTENNKLRKKLATLDADLRGYNKTSIDLLLSERSQREALDQMEKKQGSLAEYYNDMFSTVHIRTPSTY